MKIFRFVKKVFFLGLTMLSNFINENSLLSATPLNCISMKNQECKPRPQIININRNNPIFYPFSIKTNKCSGLINLMPRTNETRFIKWHEKCKCKCRLDAIICNNKQY